MFYFKPEKHYDRVSWLVQTYFRAGLVKQVMAGPRVLIGIPEQNSLCSFGIDLRDQEACRNRQVCAGVAKMIANPPAVSIPSTVPDTVGPAGEHWLLIEKAKMTEESYKVVPSKIRRFVSFVGADQPCRVIDGKKWKQWEDWLAGEVEAGRIADKSAVVHFNRNRELARWLVEEGKTKPIPGLEEKSGRGLFIRPGR